MNLRETRLDRRLTQPQIVAKMKEVEPRVDVALYSKMESGICLPTPDGRDPLGAGLPAARHLLP